MKTSNKKLINYQKKKLICEKMTNHDILRLSTSIIVLHSITKFVLQWISSGSWAMSRFRARAIGRRRKAWFLLRMSRILFASKHLSQTQLDGIAHEQTIMQEPSCHVVGSRPAMKRKKKLLRMIMLWIEVHQLWASSVMHQSLTTTVAQIVLFSKPTLSPDEDLH